MVAPRCLVVTAASGKQGSSLIRALLSRPENEPALHIRAVVRDSRSERCQKLLTQTRCHPKSTTLTIHEADFSNYNSIFAVMDGAFAVFLNTSPTFADPRSEVEHARNVLSAASESGTVQYVLYTSVVAVDDPGVWERVGGPAAWVTNPMTKSGSLPNPSYLPPDPALSEPIDEGARVPLQGYFSAKYQIEQMVKGRNQDRAAPAQHRAWSILRPAWFMSDFEGAAASYHWPELRERNCLRTAMADSSRMMLVAPSDIGSIASAILRRALLGDLEMWNREINIGSEACTMERIRDCLSVATRNSITLEYVAREERMREIRNGNRFREVQAWYVPRQDCFDPAQLERMFDVHLTRFASFLSESKSYPRIRG